MLKNLLSGIRSMLHCMPEIEPLLPPSAFGACYTVCQNKNFFSALVSGYPEYATLKAKWKGFHSFIDFLLFVYIFCFDY
jgi:hypothetical protein